MINVHFAAIPTLRKNIAPEMNITASPPDVAVVARMVKPPEASSPRMVGSRRALIRPTPRAASQSDA